MSLPGRIAVTPEGRPGVWLADRDSLIAWLEAYPDPTIHNFLTGAPMLLGADWQKDRVIEVVRGASRLGILTDGAWLHNIRHALAVITDRGGGEELLIFDIGEITVELDLTIACPRCGRPAHPDSPSCLIAEDRRSDAREAMADVVEQAAAMDGGDAL